MAGSTPHSTYPYSPTHSSNRPPYFSHDYNAQQQNYPPPQPTYPPHSPERLRNLGSPLPPPSTLPQPTGAPSNYQPLTSSPPYQTPRPYAPPIANPNMPVHYDAAVPNHAHPPGYQGPILSSPIREHHTVTNGVSRDVGPSEARPQSSEVCLWTQFDENLTDHDRNPTEPAIRCRLPAFLALRITNPLRNLSKRNLSRRMRQQLYPQYSLLPWPLLKRRRLLSHLPMSLHPYPYRQRRLMGSTPSLHLVI